MKEKKLVPTIKELLWSSLLVAYVKGNISNWTMVNATQGSEHLLTVTFYCYTFTLQIGHSNFADFLILADRYSFIRTKEFPKIYDRLPSEQSTQLKVPRKGTAPVWCTFPSNSVKSARTNSRNIIKEEMVNYEYQNRLIPQKKDCQITITSRKGQSK